MSTNISAFFMQKSEYENQLNVLLVPPDLRGNVEALAGNLNFNGDEIRYIMQKAHPFVYMLDSWIKRVGDEEATLQCLQRNLIEIERPDAAQVVTEIINDYRTKDREELLMIVNRRHQKLKRTESNVSLCYKPDVFHCYKPDVPPSCNPDTVNDYPLGNSDSINKAKTVSLEKPLKPSKPSKTEKVKDDAPSAYVVYVTENKEHLECIEKLVKQLRKRYIDVKTELFESNEYSQSQSYYIYSNLIEAEYVLFICTPSFSVKKDEDSEESRKAAFIQKLVLDFMFENSTYKGKYIPILLPGCRRGHVPIYLRGARVYDMSHKDFYDDLQRRIFKTEKYKLGDLPKKRPQLKPIEIGTMFRPGVR